MRKALFLSAIAVVGGVALFLSNTSVFVPEKAGLAEVSAVSGEQSGEIAPTSTDSDATTTTVVSTSNAGSGKVPIFVAGDRLSNPPEEVKAIYLSGWSAGSTKKVQSTIDLIKRTELNAVVVDIKDYSGLVSYYMDIPLVKESGADQEIRISNPGEMLRKFHEAGIYVIGRITVFQDPILAKARPEWAMKNKTTGKAWTDNKGLAWMDPAGSGTWDYIISIAKDATARGFDEINFDYIRFASDGTLGNISYPYWDEVTPRSKVINKFYGYLREKLLGIKISADLFGLATVNNDDLGIGQVIQDAYKNFDYIAPMIYPSHYASGFIGYKNPAEHPYEVMKYSLDKALSKWLYLAEGSSSTPAIPKEKLGKIRPWIQDFNMGATYDGAMVRKEFKAVYDSLQNSTTSYTYSGWMIWDASNTYTESALEKE